MKNVFDIFLVIIFIGNFQIGGAQIEVFVSHEKYNENCIRQNQTCSGFVRNFPSENLYQAIKASIISNNNLNGSVKISFLDNMNYLGEIEELNKIYSI